MLISENSVTRSLYPITWTSLRVYLEVNNNGHEFSTLPKTAAVNYYDKVNKVKSNSVETCHMSY